MDTPDPLIYWNTWKTKILDIVDCRMWWRVKVAEVLKKNAAAFFFFLTPMGLRTRRSVIKIWGFVVMCFVNPQIFCEDFFSYFCF